MSTYTPEIEAVLALTNRPYDEYNTILPEIKNKIRSCLAGNDRVKTFEKVLARELPNSTLRHSYRVAILAALGVE